jgi:hypothetical protein
MALYKIDGPAKRKLKGHVLPFNSAFSPMQSYFNPGFRQVIGASTSSLDQQRGAVRLMVQNNVHGIANTLHKMLQENPQQVLSSWKALGGEPNTLMHDIVNGNSKPFLDAADAVTKGAAIGCGNCNTKINGRRIGQTPPPNPIPQYIAYYAGTGSLGTNPLVSASDQALFNSYIASWQAGQDANGAYGWLVPGTNTWQTQGNQPDSPTSPDVLMRAAYNTIVNAQKANGYNGMVTAFKIPLLQPNPSTSVYTSPGQTIPVGNWPPPPSANPYAGCSSSGSSSLLSTAINVGAGALNTVVPGAGSIAAGIASNALGGSSSSCSVPADTSPYNPAPTPPVITSSIPWVPLGVAAAALTGLAIFIFND